MSKIYREYNLGGGKCTRPGCTKWARFRYLEAEAQPDWDQFRDRGQSFCTMECYRKAQPRKQYTPRWPHPGRGELHPRSKLKNHQVADIKQRIVDGEPLSSIARSYGVTRQSIAYIKSKKVWAHVPFPPRSET